jgi:hypothetical protein
LKTEGVFSEVAFSGNKNVIKKLDEKIRKCKGLIIEILRMWNAKEKMVSVNKGQFKPSTNHSDNP